jgi:hypothetical protein
MQEVYAKIQFAIHTDSGTDFNVLRVNHNSILLFVSIIQKKRCGTHRKKRRKDSKNAATLQLLYTLIK